MTRLIYHSTAHFGQISPFDDAVLQVARSGRVRIVSPYIGVSYLARIITLAPDWKLVSDLEEWLKSLSFRARPKAWGFIREHLDQIHHCPAVHAKAVISESLAMMGSANLTNTGILGRTELGILLDDPAAIAELNLWFADLWAQTSPPTVDETSAFVQWLDDEATRVARPTRRLSLSSSANRIRAKLAALQIAIPPAVATTATGALNLDTVAEILIREEQRHFDTLEQATVTALDELATKGFFLGEATKVIRRSFPAARASEIYLQLLAHTANHVRSVFGEDTRNRLTLLRGRFTQTTREGVVDALAPFDTFLAYIINALNFHSANVLPGEALTEADTKFRGFEQVILIAELIKAGLLILVDLPGRVPHYHLDPDFEWAGRFKLFPQAMQAWAKQKAAAVPVPKDIEEEEIAEDDDRALVDYSIIKIPSREGDEIEAIPDIIQRKPIKSVDTERRHKIDMILACTLKKLAAGELLRFSGKSGAVAKISEETGVGSNLVMLVLKGQANEAPKVTIIHREGSEMRRVLINPSLSWKSIKGFPLTMEVCRQILGE